MKQIKRHPERLGDNDLIRAFLTELALHEKQKDAMTDPLADSGYWEFIEQYSNAVQVPGKLSHRH